MNQRELEGGDSYGAQVDEQDPKQMQVGWLTALGPRTTGAGSRPQAASSPARVVPQLLAVLPGSSSGRSGCRDLQTVRPPEAHTLPGYCVLHQGCRQQRSQPTPNVCVALPCCFLASLNPQPWPCRSGRGATVPTSDRPTRHTLQPFT